MSILQIFLLPVLPIAAWGVIRLALFVAAAVAQRWMGLTNDDVVRLLDATSTAMPPGRRRGRAARKPRLPPAPPP